MSDIRGFPITPAHPPVRSGATGAHGLLGRLDRRGQSLHSARRASEQSLEHLHFGDRTPEGLRLIPVEETTDGLDVVAWCDRHLWGSVPGSLAHAREAQCPGCVADLEIAHRRTWFLTHFGSSVWLALLGSREIERRRQGGE